MSLMNIKTLFEVIEKAIKTCLQQTYYRTMEQIKEMWINSTTACQSMVVF